MKLPVLLLVCVYGQDVGQKQHCDECREESDCGPKTAWMTCQKDPNARRRICVCVEVAKLVYANNDATKYGCETKCQVGDPASMEKCDDGMDRFEVCSKPEECDPQTDPDCPKPPPEDCDPEEDPNCPDRPNCPPDHPDFPDCPDKPDCEKPPCKPDKPDCEKPPCKPDKPDKPDQRNCTDEEMTSCKDDLCDNTRPPEECYALCKVKRDRPFCLCDPEVSVMDPQTKKCINRNETCTEDDDCGLLQECKTIDTGFAGTITRCECVKPFQWNSQTDACEMPCGYRPEEEEEEEFSGDDEDELEPSGGPSRPGQICDENASCIGTNFTLADNSTDVKYRCQCNAGFYGAGFVDKCAPDAECDQACKDRFSEDHVCVPGDGGFTCECGNGTVEHPDYRNRCLPADDVNCDTTEDCFGPYHDKLDGDESEMSRRVQCVNGTSGGRHCRCTFSFSFLDEYGCCTDEEPEEPEKPEKPEKTCKNVKCGKCQICIDVFNVPMCVCDKENGCVGSDTGKHCWLEDDMKCPKDSYGTCGMAGTTFPVPIGSLCTGRFDEESVDEETGELESLNTICEYVKPPPTVDGRKPTTDNDKPTTNHKPKYGCCKCDKGYADLDGDTSNGCEHKVDPCQDGKNKCHENASCTVLEDEEEDEDEEEEGSAGCECEDILDPDCSCAPDDPDKPDKPDCNPETDPDCKPPKPTKPPTTLKPPRPPTEFDDSIWEKFGYRCDCDEGFFGTGLQCKPIMKGCDRFAEKCGENAECVNTEVRPFFKCLCDEGFTGDPPKELCKEELETLSVGAGPTGEEATCETSGIDFKNDFKLVKSLLKPTRAKKTGDAEVTEMVYKTGKTPLPLNELAYTGVIEFTQGNCGDDFIKGMADGRVVVRIRDTWQIPVTNDIGEVIERPLYDNVRSKGFYLTNTAAKSRGYVQFTKRADTLFKLRGLTKAEAWAKRKDTSFFELDQKLKQTNGKVVIKPAQDSFSIVIKHPGIEIKPGCLDPSKIRFFFYSKLATAGKWQKGKDKYELLNEDFIDCFFAQKNSFADVPCSEEYTTCDREPTSSGEEEEKCHLEHLTLYDALFGNNEDGVHICTTE